MSAQATKETPPYGAVSFLWRGRGSGLDCLSIAWCLKKLGAKGWVAEPQPCLSTLASSFSNLIVHPGSLWQVAKQDPEDQPTGLAGVFCPRGVLPLSSPTTAPPTRLCL